MLRPSKKLRAFSAERTLVEIVVRIAHVRVFGLVTNFRRKFPVTAMNVRNVGRQQRLIAVVPNWKRKRQDLNKAGHMARVSTARSLPNPIPSYEVITITLLAWHNVDKEISRIVTSGLNSGT